MNKQDIYKADPVLRFLRDQLHLTPADTFYIALALGVFDLLPARVYNYWFTRGGVIGALRDPEYLLTMFVIIPFFLYTYIWLPDGMWKIFDTLRSNHLVRGKDMQAYHEKFADLSRRYDKKWVIVGHRAPAQRKVDRGKVRFTAPKVIFTRQHAGADREPGARRQAVPVDMEGPRLLCRSPGGGIREPTRPAGG